MQFFDLQKFRSLAFRRDPEPDHPLLDEAAARMVFADLPPGDAPAGLAEVTHWVTTMNETESFTPGRRARVLMELDDPARGLWHSLGDAYLKPDGRPAVGRDGNIAILQALLDSATEFAHGYALCLAGEPPSRWVQRNYAQLALRRMRWLGRRLILANMLHLPLVDELWEAAHWLLHEAEGRQADRTVLPVFTGDTHPSSVKLEYVRLLMVEIANPDAMLGREVELVYRITQRLAPAAKLEPEALPNALYAVPPTGARRPGLVRRRKSWPEGTLYLDTSNCLQRLRAMMERDMGADSTQPDTLFGDEYTLGERQAMLERLMGLWGLDPPQRRTPRVRLQADAQVLGGLQSVLANLPVFDQGGWTGSKAETTGSLRIQLDHSGKLLREKSNAAAIRRAPARVVDVSDSGLGLALRRSDAVWAMLDVLLAVRLDDSEDWIVGVIRRITAEQGELRLGVQVLARNPQVLWYKMEKVGSSLWELEATRDRAFLEHFQRGILLNSDGQGVDALRAGDLLVGPGLASPGAPLDVPLAKAVTRLRVLAVREAGEDFHRVSFEAQAPDPAKPAP